MAVDRMAVADHPRRAVARGAAWLATGPGRVDNTNDQPWQGRKTGRPAYAAPAAARCMRWLAATAAGQRAAARLPLLPGKGACGVRPASLPAAAAKQHLIGDLALALVGDASGAGLGAGAVRLDGPPAKAGHGADAARDAPAAVAAKRFLRQRHAAGGAGVRARG